MAFRLLPDADGNRDRRGGKLLPKRERRRRAARRTLSVLPTLCTLGNVLCGFASVFFASRNPSADFPFHWTALTFAAIFIFLGMVMDGLDGRIARLTRNTSDLGEQLDSMADMVTFGVAPAFLAVQLIGIQTPFLIQDQRFDRVVFVIAAIYVCCAALRLARFNTEVDLPTEKSHGSFKGLPSPAAAGTVASLVLLHQHFLAHQEVPNHYWTTECTAAGMVAIMLLAAFAMVSRLRYPHLAERYLRGRVRLTTLASFFLLLLFLLVHPQATLAAGFAIYAAWAPLGWMLRRVSGRPARAQSLVTVSDRTEATRRTGS